MQQEEFKLKLDEALDHARRNSNRISGEKVREIFGGIFDDDGHRDILMSYFKSKGITVSENGSGDLTYDGPDNGDADELFNDPEDRQYLDNYMADLKRIEAINEAEKERLVLAMLSKDVMAKSRLMEQYLQMAADIARTYAGQGVFMEDLIGQANLALTESFMDIDMYIEDKGSVSGLISEVEQYLASRIMESLDEMVNLETADREADDQMAQKVNRVYAASMEFAQDMGHKASVKELSEYTDLTEDEIIEAMNILGKGSADIGIIREDKD